MRFKNSSHGPFLVLGPYVKLPFPFSLNVNDRDIISRSSGESTLTESDLNHIHATFQGFLLRRPLKHPQFVSARLRWRWTSALIVFFNTTEVFLGNGRFVFVQSWSCCVFIWWSLWPDSDSPVFVFLLCIPAWTLWKH